MNSEMDSMANLFITVLNMSLTASIAIQVVLLYEYY